MASGRLQNSHIFCVRERRGQQSNERSGASFKMARGMGSEVHAHGASRLANRKEKTTVLHSRPRALVKLFNDGSNVDSQYRWTT